MENSIKPILYIYSYNQFIKHYKFYDFLPYNPRVLGGLKDFSIWGIASGMIEKPKFGR